MPSTFLVSDFSNSQFGQLAEPFSPSQNVTLTFLGCPSRHTEINLNFDLFQALSSGGNIAGNNLSAKCEEPPVQEENRMSKSPTLRYLKVKREQPEPVVQSSKKEVVKSQTHFLGESSKCYREAKNTSLERWESQRKSGNDERTPVFYYESTSKSAENAPRRAASLDENSHTSNDDMPQRKRSKERSGEVKAFSRLRTCLKGLKQKSQSGQLTETQIGNMHLSRVLEQKASLSMQRQLRLPKAQGDMEIHSKGAQSFKHMNEKHVGSNSVLADSNIRNYAGCSIDNVNPSAEQCHSHLKPRTRGNPTIDKMFIDVLKTLIMQSGPDSGSGLTSVYDDHETGESCTYKMESEIGQSNNAVDLTTSGDNRETGENREEAWSREGAHGGVASGSDRTGGTIRCDGDKNCNHSVVGNDECDDEKLSGYDSEQMEAPDIDIFYQDAPERALESHEALIKSANDMAQRSKECVRSNEIQYQSNATRNKCRDLNTDVTYLNHFSEAFGNFSIGWETVRFSRNHNNSVNDNDHQEATSSSGCTRVVSASVDKNRKRQLIGESCSTAMQSQEQSLRQDADIVIKLTPPSPPLQSSSCQGLLSPPVSDISFDKNDLLSVPEVYMSLRARLPSAALLEMDADERFSANNVVEKELEDLCYVEESGVAELDNRPNSSPISRNFITAYIERAKEVLRNVRARPMSPQNVLGKINKYCEKAKDEAKVIKSWSFSEVVTPLCKGGLHRSVIGKFRFTDFKSKWDKFQDGYTDFKAEDAHEKEMLSPRPGDAQTSIFCPDTRVIQNDASYHSELESLDAPGSSQSYGAHTSSCRPQPVLGRASTAADKCHILKGRENIQEMNSADGTLNSKPELRECCERKSAFFRYGEASTEIKVTAYPRHRDTHETLVEMNEEEATHSAQRPFGVDELGEMRLEPAIKCCNPDMAERTANMQTSLSCSHVQHGNATTESSQGQGVFLTSVPLKSQSLLQVGRIALGESSEVMSMISQAVTIKRYPSFADLTDLNDEGHRKPDASSMEANQTSDLTREAESYYQAQDRQILSTALTNVTPFDDCTELELVSQSAEEAVSEKLTPPNSPDLGVLVGARVQTIVSLLESCSALRTESERVPSQPVHLEPNSRSIPCHSKQVDTESSSPGIPGGRQNEINLPSPPATSPGDSTSDTLNDFVFPIETYDHLIASTSKSAAAGLQRFKSKPMPLIVLMSNNGTEVERNAYSNNCDELKDEMLHETTPNSDSQVLDGIVSTGPLMETFAEMHSEECPSRPQRNICEPMGIVTCKESDSFSLSGSDSELQLKEVCNQDILSDEEEYLEQDKDVEIMQPTQPKCTTKPCITSLRRTGDPGQIVKIQNAGLKTRTEKKVFVSSREHQDAQPSKAELGHKVASKARALHANVVEPSETRSAKTPGKIKWVTESPPEEDEDSSPSPASFTDSSNWTLKQSKERTSLSNSTHSTNVAQVGNVTPGLNRGTPDKKDLSKPHSRALESKAVENTADTSGGSKSDSNNNVSTPIGNRWIRLHKGIPFNYKAPRSCCKQAPDLENKKLDVDNKGKCPAGTFSSKKKFNDNGLKVDGMRKIISLSEVSQVIGVPDPEDGYPACVSKTSDVSIISKGATSIGSAEYHLATSVSSVDFPEEEDIQDYDKAKNKPYGSLKREDSFLIEPKKVSPSNPQVPSRPYRSIRREETFSSDPRKAAHSKRYETRSSQSLQLHETVIPTQPPRPTRISYYTHGTRCWKRGEATGVIFFNKTSPDVSPEARDMGAVVKGETCVVPKLSKCIWEGTTNLHGRENTKDNIVVTSPSPQNVKRLRSRLQRSDVRAAPKARDFVQRSSVQIERCDKMIKKSADTIRASQMMVERSKRRLANTADEMRRLASKYISIF